MVEDKLKTTYRAPSLKIIHFGEYDVIATSGPIGGDGEPDYDDTAWA